MARPTWVRVRDSRSGHEYDVSARAAEHLAEGIEVIEGSEHHGAPNGPTYAETPAVQPPAKSAGRPEWEDYAVKHRGMSPEDAAAFPNKDELIAAVTSQEG